MNDWFEVENHTKILTPALLFYPERIRSNIEQMIKIAGSATRLRPHVKTYKCAEIVTMQMDMGILKFKCATLSEAKMMAEISVPDVLISYPLSGSNQQKFIELITSYPKTKFSVLVDSIEHLKSWKKLGNTPIRVFLDIDVGMGRTGVIPEKAVEIFQMIQQLDFVFCGFHAYDGHIHDSDLSLRTKTVNDAFQSVEELITKTITDDNFEIVCGGSLSFPIHATFSERQLSPGTTLLWDYGYSTICPDLHFNIAATVLTSVISKPDKNKLCLDLGYKAIASEMNNNRVYFPQIPDAVIIGHSEEHLVIEVGNVENWNIGDVLYGLPWHICPTVALHEKAQIIEQNRMVDQWEIEGRNRIYQL
ncbi:MAG: D-TA family PLP-dependent enzyme [Cyclobacteriaceae bacterium]|nr:D-TA family PLP-dependent enzyme [Cyclobacteriaceae bacterium]